MSAVFMRQTDFGDNNYLKAIFLLMHFQGVTAMLFSRFRKCALPAIAVCSLFSVSPANAAFVMMLDDPNDSAAATYIYDLGIGDFNPAAGAITFLGNIGSFVVNVVTGISKPLIGPSSLDLNSINVTGSSAGTLLVGLSDTNFINNYGSFLTSSGGTTNGSVDFNYLHSATNTEFSGNSFASYNFESLPTQLAFSSDIVTAGFNATPFSLSILAQITHSAGSQVTSFDAAVAATPSPVPLPAALWLFISALTSGYFIARKKISCK